jgi:transcriptional regulator
MTVRTSAQGTRARILELTEQGLLPREIAAILRCSTQNVYKHLAKHAAQNGRKKKAS